MEVMNRIDSLKVSSNALWGKMTVTQMVRHCSLCEQYYFGDVKVNRSFLGRIFRKAAIKGILKDENSSFKKNAPTSPAFGVNEGVNNLEVEKNKWEALVERYGTFGSENFDHWFFGKLKKTI
jgi:hypothetical protein